MTFKTKFYSAAILWLQNEGVIGLSSVGSGDFILVTFWDISLITFALTTFLFGFLSSVYVHMVCNTIWKYVLLNTEMKDFTLIQ